MTTPPRNRAEDEVLRVVIERAVRRYTRRATWADPRDLTSEGWMVALEARALYYRLHSDPRGLPGYCSNAVVWRLAQYLYRMACPVKGRKGYGQLTAHLVGDARGYLMLAEGWKVSVDGRLSSVTEDRRRAELAALYTDLVELVASHEALGRVREMVMRCRMPGRRSVDLAVVRRLEDRSVAEVADEFGVPIREIINQDRSLVHRLAAEPEFWALAKEILWEK